MIFFKHRTVGPTTLEALEERVTALEARLGPRTMDAQARKDIRALLGFEGMTQEQIDRLRADRLRADIAARDDPGPPPAPPRPMPGRRVRL